MPWYQALLLVALGLLPSLIWFSVFNKKDPHPEPKTLLAKTFLMGIIIAPMAIIFESAFGRLSMYSSLNIFGSTSPVFLYWAAFVEEFVKFYAVNLIALSSPEFDEPVDAMIYMMTAALGFAAIENILVLFRTIPDGTQATMLVWTLRSVGATLLHALSSSIVGYFLAIAWFFREHHKKLLFLGLMLATTFHFTFNLFLSSADDQVRGLSLATGLLLLMAFLVSILFDKIKERHLQRSKSMPMAVPAAVVNKA